jgi:alpha-beta hydrolase superfamily lysophospholipase
MRSESAAPHEIAVARPRFIAAGGRSLFAWHHSPPPHLRRGAGIVLCPPLGSEYMSAYRTLRILAGRLAGLGFETLRIDYDGTGNSAGDDEDPDRVNAWLGSIAHAIAETRRLSGSGPVALVGLRAGALLAVRAAAAGDVERLVLWGPFASGLACLRELKAFARLSLQDHAHEETGGSELNAAGFTVTEETVKALAGLTLDAVTAAPAPLVLVVDRDDRSVDPGLDARLEMLGSRVTRIRGGGTAEMLAPPELATVPRQALDDIASWLDRWTVSSTLAAHPAAVEHRGGTLEANGVRERPVCFGRGDRLFGILTSPDEERGSTPTIVLFNTSVEHHVGPSRLYVPLAREWAALGHHVLRFDLGGIGDSAPPNGAEENVAYPDHLLDEARQAIAFVRKVVPRRPVIAGGLCSGGWLAFLAAREGLEVDAIVSVNPPLYLRDGVDGTQWQLDRDARERYLRAMRDPHTWAKALRGGVSYATFRRVAVRVFGGQVEDPPGAVPGDVLHDGLERDLDAIAARRIRSLFVFSGHDDGLEYFRLHGLAALQRAPGREFIQHVVVDGAGHSFRPRAAKRALRALMTDFVASQTCGTAG